MKSLILKYKKTINRLHVWIVVKIKFFHRKTRTKFTSGANLLFLNEVDGIQYMYM